MGGEKLVHDADGVIAAQVHCVLFIQVVVHAEIIKGFVVPGGELSLAGVTQNVEVPGDKDV